MMDLPIKVRLINECHSEDKNGNLRESNIRFEIDGLQHQFNIYHDQDVGFGYQLVFELERILNQHQARKEFNRDKNAEHSKSR